MPSSLVETYYSRTARGEARYATATGHLEADVCVVGAGLAGLTAALFLARAGKSVIVLEAHGVAWGASGRNGGFVAAGYATSLRDIARQVGTERAKALYRLSIEGVAIVRETIAQLDIECAAPTPGIAKALRYDSGGALRIAAHEQAQEFGMNLRFLPREELQGMLVSSRYREGVLDADAFHFHPLNYARGLAREIARLGGRIHENSQVFAASIEGRTKTLRTREAEISCAHVLFTTGGYTGDLVPALEASYLPISTYMLLTKADPSLIATAIRTRVAVLDDRRAGDYYRIVDGGDRLLWGGRITTRTTEPRDVAALLRRQMIATYPQLEALKVELAWSGLMSYARHLMPQIGQLQAGVWFCTAFGGHGMNTTAIGGKVMAEAIVGSSDRYRVFAPFGLSWNGGVLGRAAAQATYWSYQLADAFRELRG